MSRNVLAMCGGALVVALITGYVLNVRGLLPLRLIRHGIKETTSSVSQDNTTSPFSSKNQVSPNSNIPDAKNGISEEAVRSEKQLSIEKFFDGTLPKKSDSVVSLLVTGDVMVGRTVNFKTLQSGNFLWPYTNVGTLLSDADITLINLENPLIKNCPTKNSGMIFCGDLRHAPALRTIGVDIASLSNNHTLNYTQDGFDQTRAVLEDNSILAVDTNHPVRVHKNNISFSFLAYDDVECARNKSLCPTTEKIQRDIMTAKKTGDIVVVFWHWGREYTHTPTTRQIELGHLTVDAGADLVVGNHPHWYQPIELYKKKPIMYSNGNFVFDQMWSVKTKVGVVGTYYFDSSGVIDGTFTPLLIENSGQPKIIEGTEGAEIIHHLNELSQSGDRK